MIALVSCGTQRDAVANLNEGPIIQTKFLGAEFGDTPYRTSRRWSRYRPMRNTDGSITILNQSFGGYTWHFVKGLFAEDMLSIVDFEQEFKYQKDAQDRFDGIYRMLRMKYGETKPTENGLGLYFTDENKNSVVISIHQSISKGGQDFWYCDLLYYWGPGSLLTQLKTLSEL